jgi:hypothetical protein
MKIYLFNSDGWAASEYLKRTGDLPDDAHIIPAGIIPALAFWNGSEVIAKTQAEKDAYDAEQAAIAESEYQNSKTQTEKIRDNWVFEKLAYLQAKYPSITFSLSDISQPAESMAGELLAKGITDDDDLTLLTRIKIAVGNSRLPTEPHNMEV